MMEEHINILKDYHTYLELKDFKKRGIEDKLRSARYFLEYIENNSIELKDFLRIDAESYREHLATRLTGSGKMRYKAESINGIISGLRLFFKYLVSVNKALKNPFLEVEKMKQSIRLPKNILSIEQMGRLLGSIEVKDRKDFKFKTVVEVLYATGCRISEIEGLIKADIDLEALIITIRDDKDRKDRIAPLSEYAHGLLRLYVKDIKEGGQVFKHGKPRSLNRFVNDRLKRLSGKLKLPLLTCHGIRHSIATHMLKKGADIREVSEFLGHKRIKNTEVYTHLLNEDLKKVIDELHPRERGEE